MSKADVCIMPSITEKIRADFKSGKLNFGELATKSDAEIVDYWKKRYGLSDIRAKNLTAKIQKAVLSPKRATALKTVLRKTILQRGNLYSDVSIENAKKMSEKFTIQELADMDSEKRIKALMPYMLNEKATQAQKEKAAVAINRHIENYKKEGRLEAAERRLFGIDNTAQAKKEKGKLAEIERLSDLGLLTPENTRDFMQSYVETQLGVSVSVDEAEKLYDLTSKLREAEKLVGNNLAITAGDDKAEAEKQMENKTEYFKAQQELINYSHYLATGRTAQTAANEVVSIVRASHLSSPKSLVNSAKYQIQPTLLGYVSKMITAGYSSKRIANNITSSEALGLSDTDPNDIKMKNFIRNQVMFGLKVYNDVGIDIARSNGSSEDNARLFQYIMPSANRPIFNGKEKAEYRKNLQQLRQQELEKSNHPKLTKLRQKTVDNLANWMALYPKWFAGLTDVVVANATKAHTIAMLSKKVAADCAKSGTLPKGVSEGEYALRLTYGAYEFGKPKDPRARVIKELAIQDAHIANNTQGSWLSDTLMKGRQWINSSVKLERIGLTKVGDMMVPFLNIPSTTLSERLKTSAAPLSIGFSFFTDFRTIDSNVTLSNEEKIIRKSRLVKDYVRYAGGFAFGFAMWLTTKAINRLFKDDDDTPDYIPPYMTMGDIEKGSKKKEYSIAKALGANTGSIRWGNTWVSLSDLDPIAGILGGLFEAERLLTKTNDWLDAAFGYARFNIFSLLEAPFISELRDKLDDAESVGHSKTARQALGKLAGDDKTVKDFIQFGASITFGKFWSRDLVELIAPPNDKYDFLGNPISKSHSDNIGDHIVRFYSGTRDVNQSLVVNEINRLYNAGFCPTITDPEDLSVVKDLKALMPADEFTEFVNTVKQQYAEEVGELIQTKAYQSKSDADKKAAIDDIRDKLYKDKKTSEFHAKLKTLQ